MKLLPIACVVLLVAALPGSRANPSAGFAASGDCRLPDPLSVGSRLRPLIGPQCRVEHSGAASLEGCTPDWCTVEVSGAAVGEGLAYAQSQLTFAVDMYTAGWEICSVWATDGGGTQTCTNAIRFPIWTGTGECETFRIVSFYGGIAGDSGPHSSAATRVRVCNGDGLTGTIEASPP
jgi:hypothetical protein